MTLFLYCIYEIYTNTTGIGKYRLINMTPNEYERIQYEESGNSIDQICEKTFGVKPDLSWIKDLNRQAELERDTERPFIETEVPCRRNTASQIAP